jgi:hypothetical protein
VDFGRGWSGVDVELIHAGVVARRFGDLGLLVRATVYLATLCRLADRPEETLQFAHEALALASTAQLAEYVGAARAHLAWLALRAHDSAVATEHARNAIEAWRTPPTVYPFVWQACWPLLELAVAREDLGEAVAHACAMLDNKQQRLPEPLTTALRKAILARPRA